MALPEWTVAEDSDSVSDSVTGGEAGECYELTSG